MNPYQSRVEKVQDVMQKAGYDYLLIGPSANMYYFSGLQTSPDERLQLLIVPAQGRPVAVLPEMYLKKAEEVLGDQYPLLGWSDQHDPFSLAAGEIKAKDSVLLAIDDTLRADHLIGLNKVLPSARFEPASVVINPLRIFKDQAEVDMMHHAAELADQVMAIIQTRLKPGLSEKEVALMVESEYKSLADDISFKPIVASGPNAALPHHSPGERILQTGDFVIIDSGALYKGYCSDITRTFCLGKATPEMKEVYGVVKEANEQPFRALTENSSLCGEEIDAVARQVINAAGYGPQFIHRLGHGIGLEVHEAPYLVEGNREPLQPGMAFTIEPGIYLPDRFGVRIEDVVVMSAAGPRRLTSFERSLIEI